MPTPSRAVPWAQRRCGGKHHRWCGVEKFRSVVFSNAKDVKPHPIGMLNTEKKLAHLLGGIAAVASHRGDKTIDSNFHD